MNEKTDTPLDFVREIVSRDTADKKYDGKVVTRFPPEPNGYLHIGHAKSICLNYGIAEESGGTFHLRFDDTNPATEDIEYVESIKRDIAWLGVQWGEHLYFASDYFDQLYEYAEQLIRKGKAYVCSLDTEAFKEYRGVPTRPGKEPPARNRPPAESLDLFRRMRAGEFEDGSYVLRAKIDMASPNLHMRDPVLYRIKRMHHHRTGDAWCIYPTYDFTHGQSDSIEKITHSICTLEFEVHRPLYDWILDELEVYHPQQIEFAPLNLTYTLMSKRKLLQLVEEGSVDGWDDPRLPTIAGLRRRGYTPASIRTFCRRVGVTKVNSLTEISLLEHCVREDLNKTAPRVMAVMDPVRLVVENYPEDTEEQLEAVNNPEDPAAGRRTVPFSRVLYIERSDFKEEAPKKFYRLVPGREVRLRYGYFVTCTGFERDENSGEITEVRCTYDPATRGGDSPDGRKVRGTIHWVSAKHAVEVPVRLYDRLFTQEDPEAVPEGEDFHSCLNPDSLQAVTAFAEPSLRDAQPEQHYQFERTGYFVVDPQDSASGRPVFNRVVPLRDSWAKMARRMKG